MRISVILPKIIRDRPVLEQIKLHCSQQMKYKMCSKLSVTAHFNSLHVAIKKKKTFLDSTYFPIARF
jgi:hypothetical protein